MREFDRNPGWSKETLLEVSKKTGLSEAQVYKWGWDQKRKKYGDDAVMMIEGMAPPGMEDGNFGSPLPSDCEDDDDSPAPVSDYHKDKVKTPSYFNANHPKYDCQPT